MRSHDGGRWEWCIVCCTYGANNHSPQVPAMRIFRKVVELLNKWGKRTSPCATQFCNEDLGEQAMPRLSIMYTLRESINLLMHEWRFFGTVIIGPVLIITGASLTARMATQKAAGTALAILTFVVLMFSLVRIAVCCHRFILLGEQPRSFIQGCRWQERDTWFAFYVFAIYLFAWFFVFLALLGAGALSPFLQFLPKWLLILLFALGAIGMWLLFSYLMGRLSLVLPVTAIDQRPEQDWALWAWSRSEGNQWPLLFLLGINPSLGWILLDGSTGIMIEHARQSSALLVAPIYGLSWGLYFFATIFQVAVLSLSQKQLSVNLPTSNPSTVSE